MNEVAEEVQVEQPTVTERPEWLAEKFNTPEDLASAYSNLESKLGQSEESVRTTVMSELEEEFNNGRPASAGEYELPETIDPELANDNELLQWWANEAWENGYSQEEFNTGIDMYVNAINATQPDIEAEFEQLGENAQDRVNAVELWSNANFGEEHMDAIRMLGSTAKGIEVLEILMDKLKGSSVNGQAQPVGAINEADLTNMMKDPRYWSPKDRDHNFIQQVNEGFGKLYGNK
tara:strand:- start:3846 stop:4547 length:702 start_codon:yes stop_codon:yes gene_type:complete